MLYPLGRMCVCRLELIFRGCVSTKQGLSVRLTGSFFPPSLFFILTAIKFLTPSCCWTVFFTLCWNLWFGSTTKRNCGRYMRLDPGMFPGMFLSQAFLS